MFKMMKKSSLLLLLSLVLITSILSACSKPVDSSSENGPQQPTGLQQSIILSTTTSTENSGLLDAILPIFTEDTGISVKVVAVGTGQAIKMGEDGDADVLLAHAKASEEKFVEEGHGIERFDVMYNDFVLVGPADDPMNLSTDAPSDILKAFSLIHENNGTFISRGDDSGTHKMELALWQELNIETTGKEYISAGQGMGAVLQMADELMGYTLTDRATYLSMMDKLDLDIIVEGDVKLFNQYGIIAVNPNKNDKINKEGAEAFINWMLSEKGQNLIGEFGKDLYGQSLFIPNAK